MRPHTDFKPETSKAILLMGDSGSGKTNLAFTFPSPFIIDWGDSNLANAVERHRGKPFFYGRVDQEDDGTPIAESGRWNRSVKLLDEAIANDAVRTIVDDTLSMMQPVLKAHLIADATKNGEKLPKIAGDFTMNQSLWDPFARFIRQRIIKAKTAGKFYILVCHVGLDENELTLVKEMRPALQGQLGKGSNGGALVALFNDFWLCEATPSSDPKYKPRGVRYYVRSAPTNRVKLKTSFPTMDAEVDASWFATDEFQARLNGKATLA